jgi:hypothetical protein
MKVTVTVSQKNKLGLWTLFGFMFLYWLVLLLTSGYSFQSVLPDLLLLAIACSLVPVIASFVYVTIDEEELTVPFAAFFRKVIPIENIRALRYKPSGLGFIKGIDVEYLDHIGRVKIARLPSLTTFGKAKTYQMIAALSRINSSIKVDARITAVFVNNSVVKPKDHHSP